MHSAIEKCASNRKTVDCISCCLLIQEKNKNFHFKKGKSKVFKRISRNKNVRKKQAALANSMGKQKEKTSK